MIGMCSACAFFDDDNGRCRRHAPEVVTLETSTGEDRTLTVLGVWPAASADDYCGEFQSKVRA